jgi:hypothetical protein
MNRSAEFPVGAQVHHSELTKGLLRPISATKPSVLCRPLDLSPHFLFGIAKDKLYLTVFNGEGGNRSGKSKPQCFDKVNRHFRIRTSGKRGLASHAVPQVFLIPRCMATVAAADRGGRLFEIMQDSLPSAALIGGGCDVCDTVRIDSLGETRAT